MSHVIMTNLDANVKNLIGDVDDPSVTVDGSSYRRKGDAGGALFVSCSKRKRRARIILSL